MSERSLFFIPDISGFTNFVLETENAHSRHIISELLELLIDSNEIGLELAEIEGDALFFYKVGELPDWDALFRQLERMFLQFHNHLVAYTYRRICRCGACTSASNLQLKFIIHAGEMEFISVKEHKKPFGTHVVLAHRLLKNSIEEKEYALLTNELIEHLAGSSVIEKQLNTNKHFGSERLDVGLIEYTYYDLSPLKSKIDASQAVEPGTRIDRPWRDAVDIQAPVEVVYDLLSNFDRRSEWIDPDIEVHYQADRVNRSGTEHECIVNEKLINFTTITSDFGGKWVYGERAENIPLVEELNTYYILEPVDEKHTRLSLEVHPYSRSFLKRKLSIILKAISWNGIRTSLQKIKAAAERSEKS